MNSSKTTRTLIEGAMMIALATVLSIFKLVEMPYGGSVTLASMLPIIIFSYRHGILWGLGAGSAHAVIQQLLGLNTLSYVTGWQSVVAVIMLDYVLAFAVTGLGGIFRRAKLTQPSSLLFGSLAVCVLRYVLHTVAGATVWAGLSIPDSAALIYSIGYNATYMIPETIVTAAVAYYLGGVVDFTRPVPTRVTLQRENRENMGALLLSGLSVVLGVVIDIWLIAPKLQDPKTGEFIFSGLSEVSWLSVTLVTVISAVFAVFLFVRAKKDQSDK